MAVTSVYMGVPLSLAPQPTLGPALFWHHGGLLGAHDWYLIRRLLQRKGA